MIGDAIRLVLGNVMPIALVVALVGAAVTKGRAPSRAEHFLAWLLGAFGIQSIWGGVFNAFVQDVAARSIGWAPSPFEFEIGWADMAIGVAALVAAWRSLDFKAAVVLVIAVFSFGIVWGHIDQRFVHGDTAPNNFGAMLIATIIWAVLLVLLYRRAADARPQAAP